MHMHIAWGERLHDWPRAGLAGVQHGGRMGGNEILGYEEEHLWQH